MVFFFRSNLRHLLFAPVLMGGVLLTCVSAQAQVNGDDIKFSLSETGVWDSNPMMRLRNAEEIYGATTTPRLSILNETETTKIGFDTWLDNSIFNRAAYNTTDYHALLDLAKETQRLAVGLKASTDYDTTRTSELTNFGLQTDLSRHFAYTLTPSIGYSLSPISKVELLGSYSKSVYDGDNYADYHTISLSPSYTRNFTELYAGVFSVNARRYESDEGRSKVVDSIGPSVGVLAKLTPDFSAQLRLGAEMSQEKVNGVVVQKWEWSTVFGSDITYKGDQDTFRFSANRAQQSYGNGNNALLTSFEAKEDRQINPNLVASVGGTYQFSNKDSAATTNLDTRYTGNIGLVYRITPSLDVSTTYKYRHETYVSTSDEAKENIARLGLSFHPKLDSLF